MGRRFEPGTAVALREIWRGRVWNAFPATVVEDGPRRAIFHVPVGTGIQRAVGASGDELRVPADTWTLEERGRAHQSVLSFAWPGVAHSVELFWDPSQRFVGWYVNLQSPLRRSPVGFDYVDHLLDVVVMADRRWRWKDEDELADAVRLGLLTPDRARDIRAEGKLAIAQLQAREEPFDGAWIAWRPDPSWSPPTLPPGWTDLPEGRRADR